MQNVWVAPDWRLRGVARALMNAVVAHCDEAGLGRVWLRAMEAGEPLYERLGFVERPRYMHRDLPG